MNDQQRAAMQMALEALENTSPLGWGGESDTLFYGAIAALREALAQPQGDDDLTIAYMVGYEKGKDYMKEKAAKMCDELGFEPEAEERCAAAIRSMK